MIEVELTWYEFAGAVDVALRRFEHSEARGWDDSTTYERGWMERLVDAVIGAAGERAFCKARALYWDGSVNTFHRSADVGRDWEVRTTPRPEGCLIIRTNDAPNRWYVLVTAEPPCFIVRGYIHGTDARRPEFIRDPHEHRPSWFVPQHALQSLHKQHDDQEASA